MTERIVFGETDLNVSVLVLGTWVTGGWMWGGAEEGEARKAILTSLENGVDFIDTAPVYGFGKSEEIVGRALREWTGERPVVATKCGLEWLDGGQRVIRNSKPERIRREVDDSLQRLGVDVIDLYQIHWPDSNTPFDETFAEMLRLRDQGKIRYIGASNFSREQLEEARKTAPVVALQPPYNLFERDIDGDVLPYCERENVATLVYGGLCRGLLSGKFSGKETFPQGDLRRFDPKFKPDKFPQFIKAVERFKRLAARYDKSVAQFALRWAVQRPGVTTVIAGARTSEQARENAGVMGWRISGEDMLAVEEILNKHIKTPVGPEFMAPPK